MYLLPPTILYYPLLRVYATSRPISSSPTAGDTLMNETYTPPILRHRQPRQQSKTLNRMHTRLLKE